jgi:hypothetical protein
MTLSDKQEKFSENLGLLLIWLKVSGYRFKLWELHDSLSIDIDIYDSKGVYCAKQGSYKPAGEYWRSLGMAWNGWKTFSYAEE